MTRSSTLSLALALEMNFRDSKVGWWCSLGVHRAPRPRSYGEQWRSLSHVDTLVYVQFPYYRIAFLFEKINGFNARLLMLRIVIQNAL